MPQSSRPFLFVHLRKALSVALVNLVGVAIVLGVVEGVSRLAGLDPEIRSTRS